MRTNETDRWLDRLVGLVVLAALGCLGWAVVSIGETPPAVYLLVVATLLTLAGLCRRIHLNLRQQLTITSGGAAILVAVVLLPPPWAILAVAVAVLIGQAAHRRPLRKAAFNTATETLGVSAASAAFHAVGGAPITVADRSLLTLLVALVVAMVAYALVDELVSVPVIALASRTSWWRLVRGNALILAVVRATSLALALATVTLHAINPVLVTLAPLGVLVAYLAYRHRLHLREERRAWQQLAASTDALSSVGVDNVLYTAIRGAAGLFPDLKIEVELADSEPRRVVRGDRHGVHYDGDPRQAPTQAGPCLSVPLGLDTDQEPLGMLRLWFRVEARLSDREQYMLATFTAGLSTAIRNAAAYAEVSRLAERHAYDASHDALTDLPNRRQLHGRVTQLWQRGEPGTVALMLLDIDHFKEVNDTLGHDAGDQVIVEVGQRLRAAAGDSMVIRLGGDEFAVLFDGLANPAAASGRAWDVLATLRHPMDLRGVLISLHTSAGLAVASDPTDPTELLRRADVAMYQAKDSGRQVAVYARTSDSADRTRLALAGELPRAVEGREFAVHYQPIVDLASGRVLGAEALTRWAHPDLGDLPPATFLGLVERSGLLAPFTETVLNRALAAAAYWRREGFELQIAVNVSPRSLGDPRLPAMVLDALQAHGVPPQRLTLELTESAAIGYLEVVTCAVATLREAGIRIALDDFGTRHSSLSAVFQLPVDQLKIDRTFVSALGTSREAKGLVCSILELGRELGQLVVAEGVEEVQQRQTLWELGCVAAQGSLFGWPPQTSDALLRSLRQGFDGEQGTLAPKLQQLARADSVG
ncbi:EAL domain-containing protein [Natronosporangium hydrolyticum]|uniref:EAL domain-containing protein n=1 Tax=Natronosporangium hydrolyticum TaxID=2811111 RepID=A0A895YNL7_9ACTN|nr:bifunctional diguanylate cyclase/phosphodiesterase [Natronosporangium hydrolyticum]QSB16296.1 EAL domain-containing protein [Natronosporangium hydrolyticum]